MQAAHRQIVTTAPAALLDPAPAGLVCWYAVPLQRHDAAVLLDMAQAAIQQRLRRGGDCYPLQLLALMCRFWQGADVHAHYRELAAAPAENRARALLELVYGQLLVSRKLTDADFHLAQGFGQAAGLLSSADYFALLRRHELLGFLPLADTPAPARDLPQLLAEAAVIRRLQGTTRQPTRGTHLDTLG